MLAKRGLQNDSKDDLAAIDNLIVDEDRSDDLQNDHEYDDDDDECIV